MATQTLGDVAASYNFMAGEGDAGESPVQMAFDPSRSLLAAGLHLPHGGYRIDVLDLSGEAPKLAAKVETPKQIPRPLGFLPDGRLLYSAYHHAVIVALDGGQREQIAVADARVACVRPDGAVLFNRQRLVLWEGGQLRELEDKRAYMATSVDMSPDGKFAVSTGVEPYVRLWDVASGKQLKRVTVGGGGTCYAAFSPDGTVLACGGDKDKATGTMSVLLLNVDKKWSERGKLALSSRLYVCGLGFSADGERLWVSQHNVGAAEGEITVWDWRAGLCLHTIKIAAGATRQYARHVAMSADGRRVFVMLPEPAGRVLVFDVA